MSRTLSDEARAAMSAGAKKARAKGWGAPRSEGKKVIIDADVADLFTSTVPARFRRAVATGGIRTAIDIYKARAAAAKRQRDE